MHKHMLRCGYFYTMHLYTMPHFLFTNQPTSRLLESWIVKIDNAIWYASTPAEVTLDSDLHSL